MRKLMVGGSVLGTKWVAMVVLVLHTYLLPNSVTVICTTTVELGRRGWWFMQYTNATCGCYRSLTA